MSASHQILCSASYGRRHCFPSSSLTGALQAAAGTAGDMSDLVSAMEFTENYQQHD
jgi:hypothetical protein